MRNSMTLLKESIGRFKTNPKLFIGIVLVPVVVSFIGAILAPSEETGVVNTYEWLVYVALSLFSVVLNILMGIALVKAADNTSLTVGQAYGEAKSYFWRYILLSILLTVILIVGFLLFLIPGVILAIWFSFSMLVLVLENTGVTESLKRSRQYVKGKWWAVFVRSLFIGFIAFLIILPFSLLAAAMADNADLINGIASLIVSLLAPIGVIYMYFMYQDAKTQISQ